MTLSTLSQISGEAERECSEARTGGEHCRFRLGRPSGDRHGYGQERVGLKGAKNPLGFDFQNHTCRS